MELKVKNTFLWGFNIKSLKILGSLRSPRLNLQILIRYYPFSVKEKFLNEVQGCRSSFSRGPRDRRGRILCKICRWMGIKM